MLKEKVDKLKSLSRRETEVLHYFFREKGFAVSDIVADFGRNEKTIRSHITTINRKLGVPVDINDNEKREWLVQEYLEAYEYVFKRGEWEFKRVAAQKELEEKQARERLAEPPQIYVKPPDPIPVNRTQTQRPQPTRTPTQTQASPNITFIVMVVFGVLLISTLLLVAISWIINNNPAQEASTVQEPPANLEADATIQAALATSEAANDTLQAIATADQAIVETSQAEVLNTKVPDRPIPQPTATEPVIFASPTPLPDPILFFDHFDGGQISPRWEYYADSLTVANSYLYVDQSPFTGFPDGQNVGWVDYIINIKVVVQDCWPSDEKSSINIRGNNASYISAFSWHSCDYREGTYLDLEITVQGDQWWTVLNGREVVQNRLPVPENQAGGIALNIKQGNAIDYVQVAELP